jgi:glycosyltransferase involved in cell wall biosynthesis
VTEPSVLHVLPHAGGGGETYLDLLAELDGFRQERRWLSTSRSPLAAPLSILAGRRALAAAARGADIVDVHGDTGAMLSAPLLRRSRSIVTTHGLSMLRRAQGPLLAVARRRFRAAALAADRVVCTSAPERDELAGLLPPAAREHLVVIPPGMHVPAPVGAGERAQAREALGLSADAVVAVCLGRLDQWKDPLTAVRAANDAGVELLVAGDGPLDAEVRAAAGPAVHVLGFRDDPERLIEAADIFVLPSRREGTSMALLEAMGRGLAPVVSDGLGNPDVVGDAGLVFPCGDDRALAAALRELAADASSRERLGTAAHKRIASAYSAELFLERMGQLFTGLLA